MFANTLLKTLRLLIPTFIALAFGVVVLNRLAELPFHYQSLFSQLPYLLAGICLILCISFNQGRLFLASLNLLCLFSLIQSELQTSLDNPANYVLFTLLTLLFPLQQVLISLYGERGISLRWALPRGTIIVVGYLLLYTFNQYGLLANWITSLPMSLVELAFDTLLLSEGAALVFLLSILCVVLVLLLRTTLVDAALLAATLGCLFTLLIFDKAYISALYASLTLLLFLYTVLFNSYSMAFIDELTNLPGRRALENHLASTGRNYSIAMVDVDHFKKFNDTYGHDVGDQVLRMVASQMKQAAKGCSVFRYGGEEFTIVFNRKDEAAALPIAEQVREAVANYPMRIRDTDRPEDTSQGRKQRKKSSDKKEIVQVCISIGLCEKTDEHNNSKEVLKQADESLYLAKQQGRNRTVAAHIVQTRKRKQATPVSA
ncbi:MAG: GGDEF domain-containing protein [Amphritea sp.]